MILLMVITSVAMGWCTSVIARERKRDPFWWFLLGAFFGSLVLFILLYRYSLSQANAVTIDELRKQRQKQYLFEEWYYLGQEEEPVGPVPFRQLAAKWKEGEIAPSDWVWNPSLDGWKRLSEWKDLCEAFE